MRQNKQGSILLYVLFLCSFLALFFVSFQWTLESMLEWAQDSEGVVQEASNIKDTLVLLNNKPYTRVVITANSNLSLVSSTKSGSVLTEELGGSEPKEYWVTSTGWATSFSLNILSRGPVSYHLAAFNSGSENTAIVVWSGVVTGNGTMSLSGTANTHILVIDPLGWYVRYSLDTGSGIVIPAVSSYTLERNINGYKQSEWIYEVVNFQPKSRSGFDYQKMGMYLDF